MRQKNKAQGTVQHTPGPWTIALSSKNYTGHEINSAVRLVAFTSTDYENTSPLKDVDIANARLIAAAPELLTAMQNLLDGFIHVPGDEKGNKARTGIFKHCKGFGNLTARAREAITKATKQ